MSKDLQIALRVDKKEKAQLQKEADEKRRKLADYIRYLVETHPERKKR